MTILGGLYIIGFVQMEISKIPRGDFSKPIKTPPDFNSVEVLQLCISVRRLTMTPKIRWLIYPKIIRTAGCMALWKYRSCEAEIGIGKDWATVYVIVSEEPSKGHATTLLLAMKEYYENKGLTFGGSIALNERMKNSMRNAG